MLQYTINIFRSIYYSFVFTKDIKKQQRFFDLHFLPIIQNFEKGKDSSLTAHDLKRLKVFATLIPAMLGESFATLRGDKMSERERWTISLLGSLTGLFDDLFDNQQNSAAYIKNLLDSPNLSQASNSFEYLLVDLYQKALKCSPQPELIKEYAVKVYYAQLESQKQSQNNLSHDELTHITYEKGGLSIPLYRCAFVNTMDKTENELLYHLGAIGQLGNDIFDINEDYCEGISTLATTTADIESLEKNYKELIDKIFRLINETSFQAKNKLKFKYRVSLIVSRALVSLNQLRKTAKNTDGKFKIDNYSKKSLICDMEKPSNMLKLLHYAAICIKK